MRGMLASHEELVTIVGTEQRLISVTTRRVILHERSGGYSVIRNDHITTIEVSDNGKGGKFLKLHFGGGLSRTVGAPDAVQAAAIVNATTYA